MIVMKKGDCIEFVSIFGALTNGIYSGITHGVICGALYRKC